VLLFHKEQQASLVQQVQQVLQDQLVQLAYKVLQDLKEVQDQLVQQD
jgi:hypothetical protein